MASQLPLTRVATLSRFACGQGVLLLALLATAAWGADDRPETTWAATIDPLIDRRELEPALWGIEVRDVASGKILYSRNARTSLAPGSLVKLATTAAVLDAFGPEATLLTTVESTAPIDKHGRLSGDVYLVGRGDPTLWGSSSEAPVTAFDRLADALVNAGVKRIEGRLIGHEGAFTGSRRGEGWAWEDLTWYYGAESAALCFNNGAVHLGVSPGKHAGDPLLVNRNPVSSAYSVVVSGTTSPAGTPPNLVVERAPGTNTIHVGGTLPHGTEEESLFVAIEDPARFATQVFRETLEAKGVRVRGTVSTSQAPLPADVRTLAGIPSPPMAQIIRDVNLPSHNQRAEMLLRLLGGRVKGEGSAAAGLTAVREFLLAQGVDTTGWSLHDGSGLSPANLATARGFVDLLCAMRRHRFAATFTDGMPLMGVSGTVRRRLKDTPAEGRIRAKSGLIRHANGLAGFVTTRAGDDLAFAILLDHHTLRTREAMDVIDAIALALEEHAQHPR